MTLISFFPLRWDWRSFAKWTDLRPSAPTPYISAKIARDIGMSASELDRLQHQWPSQSPDRCRF